MSYITDVLIVTAGGEGEEAIAYVNRWLIEQDSCRPQLRELATGEAGGCKAFSPRLWAGGLNYLDVYGLAEVISGAPWRIPGVVVAYFDPESGPAFVMSPARPGQWEISG